MVGINSNGPNFNQPDFNKKSKKETPQSGSQVTQNTSEASAPASASITANAVDILAYANQALINRPKQALSTSTQKALNAFEEVHQLILTEFQHIAGIENKAPAIAYAVLNRHYKG